MIRTAKSYRRQRRVDYKPVFLLIPRTVRDRNTDGMVRVWGGGMARRWPISDRRWHYRSIGGQ